MMIVIPKPNKELYDSPKSFYPIVLLNILEKLIEKVISDHLQFHTISNNFIHQSQLSSLKHRSTTNIGVILIHFIYMGWIRNNMTSTLSFGIAQFFPLLNHFIFSHILRKVGFNSKVKHFFSNYLVDRKTWYLWNNFSSSFFNVDVGVGQGFALSPISSALYLAPVLHILEKCLKILKIPISILSFVDNGLFVAQSKSFTISNSHLFCSYNITSNLLKSFGLTMKYLKTEVFYFSRLHEYFDSLSLDISILGGPIPCPRDTWKYLDFIFDRKLMFCQHINFYVNKAISMVKCMKILGNSTCGLISHQNQLLYRSCVLPITLYSF